MKNTNYVSVCTCYHCQIKAYTNIRLAFKLGGHKCRLNWRHAPWKPCRGPDLQALPEDRSASQATLASATEANHEKQETSLKTINSERGSVGRCLSPLPSSSQLPPGNDGGWVRRNLLGVLRGILPLEHKQTKWRMPKQSYVILQRACLYYPLVSFFHRIIVVWDAIKLTVQTKLATRIFMVQINSKIWSSQGFQPSYWALLRNESTHVEDRAGRGVEERTSAIMWMEQFSQQIILWKTRIHPRPHKHHRKERVAALISSSTL